MFRDAVQCDKLPKCVFQNNKQKTYNYVLAVILEKQLFSVV